MSEQAKVGQVWRCEGGAELRVTRVGDRIAHFERRDSSTAAHVVAYMTPTNGWTLVQDGPEAACTSDCHECGLPPGAHNADCHLFHHDPRTTDGDDGPCDHGAYAGDDCDPCARRYYAKHACSALRGTLPKSEQFVASGVMSGPYAAPSVAAFTAAEADLRRKVSSFRSWPRCPVSKQELRIEAKMSEDVKHGNIGSPSETLRTWQAAFTCPHCVGGGK